jgi:short-subunit dehydrogenase
MAPMQLTRALLKPMREQGGGRILQIASVGGQIALPVSSPYHAATWGLEGFTEAIRQAVAECGVYLTMVAPGGMRTACQAGLQWTTETPGYRDATVGRVRRWIEGADDRVYTGDPAKRARASFDTTTSAPPPLRLTLGSEAYD